MSSPMRKSLLGGTPRGPRSGEVSKLYDCIGGVPQAEDGDFTEFPFTMTRPCEADTSSPPTATTLLIWRLVSESNRKITTSPRCGALRRKALKSATMRSPSQIVGHMEALGILNA